MNYCTRTQNHSSATSVHRHSPESRASKYTKRYIPARNHSSATYVMRGLHWKPTWVVTSGNTQVKDPTSVTNATKRTSGNPVWETTCAYILETYSNVHFAIRHSSFAKKCGLKRHLITHTGKKAYTCAKCDQSFGYLYVLRKHLVNVHDGVKSSTQDKRKSSNEVYTCDQCYKEVTSKQSLKKHIELHTAQKTFKCSECNECFSSKDYLSKHKWKHTDRYMCEECGRTFDGSSHLNTHLKMHEKQRRNPGRKKAQVLYMSWIRRMRGRPIFAPAIFYVNDSAQYSRRADEISKWKTTI